MGIISWPWPAVWSVGRGGRQGHPQDGMVPCPQEGGGACVWPGRSRAADTSRPLDDRRAHRKRRSSPCSAAPRQQRLLRGRRPEKRVPPPTTLCPKKKNTVAAGETRPAHGAAGGGGHRRVAPPTPAPAARGRVRPTRRQPARPALAAPLTEHPALPRELPFFVSHPARCQESLVLDARGGAQATAGGARRARTGLMLSTEEQDSTAVCASCTSAYALARQRCQRRGSQRGGGGGQHAAPAARPWPWRGYGWP